MQLSTRGVSRAPPPPLHSRHAYAAPLAVAALAAPSVICRAHLHPPRPCVCVAACKDGALGVLWRERPSTGCWQPAWLPSHLLPGDVLLCRRRMLNQCMYTCRACAHVVSLFPPCPASTWITGLQALAPPTRTSASLVHEHVATTCSAPWHGWCRAYPCTVVKEPHHLAAPSSAVLPMCLTRARMCGRGALYTHSHSQCRQGAGRAACWAAARASAWMCDVFAPADLHPQDLRGLCWQERVCASLCAVCVRVCVCVCVHSMARWLGGLPQASE
jgi:hypothetical protein